MARLSEEAKGISYPQLSQVHINHLIWRLLNAKPFPEGTVGRAHDEQLIGYLIGFYSKRWGLPPAIERPRPPD